MAVQKKLDKAIKHAFLYPYKTWQERVAIWRFVKDIPYECNHPSRHLFQETETSLSKYTNTPILACWGMKDFCFHGGFLKAWQDKLPHIVSHKFEMSGHYLLEDDFESCLSKIEPFLFS